MSADPNLIAADLKALKEHLAAKAAAEEKAVATWFKNNYLHLLNAGGIVAALLKLFGKI